MGAGRVTLVALALVGCTTDGSRSAGAGEGQAVGQERTASTERLAVETRGRISADSLLEEAEAVRTIDSLQVVADTAREPDAAAPALLRLGLLKLRLWGWRAPYSVVASRPQDYYLNEIAGGYLYQGHELKALLDRFPDHVLTDDAAYAATELPIGGECEGWIPCYVWAGTGRLVDFLEAYPTSSLAPQAVETINRAWETAVAEHPDLTVATELYDPVEVREQLERYEAVARALPAAPRAAAFAKIAELWRRFGEEGRAQGVEGG